MQTVTPYLLYEDVNAALDWLAAAFGFSERLHFTDAEGQVTHAEMIVGDSEVMLGHPGPEYSGPRSTGYVHTYVHVYVDDVDALFDRAKDAGAEVLSVPEDKPYGDRTFDVADVEGHRWSFSQHLRDVPPEEWGATSTSA